MDARWKKTHRSTMGTMATVEIAITELYVVTYCS
jgi:hypothetical protein